MLLILIALGLLLVLVFAYQASRTALALTRARTEATTLQTHVVAADFVAAQASLGRLRESTSSARGHSDGLLWSIAGKVPVLGRNVVAVRTTSRVLDDAARTSLPTAVELSKAVQEGRFRPRDGQLDLTAIKELGPTVDRAASALRRQHADLATVDAQRLLPALRDTVGGLQDQVAGANSAAQASSTAVRMLPRMLGEDGPRTWLLVIQNNAEIRSTGGLPGSFALLRSDRGKVTMGFQGASEDLANGRNPLRLTKAERRLFGSSMGVDLRDTNFTPDFPRAAELMARMTGAARDADIDGVVSIDPVGLSYLIKGLGPVRVGEVELTHDNVVEQLLHQPYQRFGEPGQQNDFFEKTARKVFDTMMQGVGNQQQLLSGLAQGARERRVLVWSGTAAEKTALAGTPVAGELVDTADRTPRVGLFLTDATAGKMQYFLDYRAGLNAHQCDARGRQALDATMLLTSRVPADFSALSRWVLGFGSYVPQGSMQMNLRVFAPAGGSVNQITVNGKPVTVNVDRLGRREVSTVPVTLAPGERALVAVTLLGARGQTAQPVLTFTPGLVSQPNDLRVPSACH